MRSLIKFALLSLAIATLPYSLQAKDEKKETVYAFGYSTNLNDTTLFISAVQPLEGAVLTRKEHFLEHRNEYGNQLKAHLENLYPGHHVCAVFFSKNKKSLDKKYAKLRTHLLKMKHTQLTEIPNSEFQFKPLVLE